MVKEGNSSPIGPLYSTYPVSHHQMSFLHHVICNLECDLDNLALSDSPERIL